MCYGRRVISNCPGKNHGSCVHLVGEEDTFPVSKPHEYLAAEYIPKPHRELTQILLAYSPVVGVLPRCITRSFSASPPPNFLSLRQPEPKNKLAQQGGTFLYNDIRARAAAVMGPRLSKKVSKKAILFGIALVVGSGVAMIDQRLLFNPTLAIVGRVADYAYPTLAIVGRLANYALSVFRPLYVLFQRLLERVIDWVVPVLVITLGARLVSSDGDGDAKNSLRKLFQRDRPIKEYIKVRPLEDRLASYRFSLQKATASKADALKTWRRRELQQRFNDDLGTISDSGLAGIQIAETEWRKQATNQADRAENARKQVREIAVQLGNTSLDRQSKKALKLDLAEAQSELSESLAKVSEIQVKFLTSASRALGSNQDEARQALAELAARPAPWDLMSPPLESSLSSKHKEARHAFVLDFPGDVEASSVETLRQEITAILAHANTTRGDSVILRLVSGGGTVTGYGLAAGQLLRIKEKGLKLTVCVEQVAASGGYMMACVADSIVASPFAVLGSIGVIQQMPNYYERLNKEGVKFSTITAGKYKRTLTPFKEIEDADVAKAREELQDIFQLFQNFVAEQRPQLDIEAVATGETWFGQDAIDRKLADSIQTFDDYLNDLYNDNVKIYSVNYEDKEDKLDLLRSLYTHLCKLVGAGSRFQENSFLPHRPGLSPLLHAGLRSRAPIM